MKSWLGVIGAIALAGGALWFVVPNKPIAAVPAVPNGPARTSQARSSPRTTQQLANPEEQAGTGFEPGETVPTTEAAPAPPKPIALASMAKPPEGPELAPGLTPVTVMENVRTTFRNYSSRFGGNPVGTNQEITRALNGANPGNTPFLQLEDGLEVNGQGELVDNWGTPFFFHQLSRTEIEIHSAGPDRKMWTTDDLVMK